MKYNPYERDWQYTKPDSKPIYNPYEREWQMKK
jgi:transposase